MKRLLLASHGIGALRDLVDDPAGMRFVFVPTAAGPDAEEIHDAIVAAHPAVEFVRLTDDRAVLVRGEAAEVVASPSPA
jgi:hypothetical protein